jgi:hypothetical protein
MCPLGHHSVRVVPVVYGLRGPDAEEEQEVAAHRLISGGCIVSTSSPAYHAYCDTCGYEYDPESECWERRSPGPNGFVAAFSPLITSFKVPKGASTDYLQQSRDGVSTWQRVSFVWEPLSSEDFNNAAKEIGASLRRQSLSFGIGPLVRADRYPNASKSMEFGLHDGSYGTTESTIALVYHDNPPSLDVEFSIHGPGRPSCAFEKYWLPYETIGDKYYMSRWAREQLGGP